MLRAFPLAHGRVLDRLLEELPRLTSDAESINAAARKLIALSIEYMDGTSVTGVPACQEERDRRMQWRLSVVNEASGRPAVGDGRLPRDDLPGSDLRG
ncbi:hypothetical protein [Streptomyces mirabilis]|jgi:hypothetical protein|uniref:Uncharacterized protein n=1 Tax=Streptomyces mirabilis TaxID=68239 RepID=A0A1I2VXU7_9ACTN|nr:hypothetical protein [Streptomyces mirabilis]SFG93970.1 hypothetical protein SAMN02787118_13416 [Streptomyces mirabilis]